MTVNYTSLLALGQPVTGTESGTWGDDVNNAVTSYLDIAIAGTLSLTAVDFTAGALTLANTQGTSSATNIGSTSAQYMVIKVSSLATNSTITAPSHSKLYLVINADSTYTITIKASGQTGYTVGVGTRAWVVFNGTDYVLASTNDITKFTGTLGVSNGGTGQSSNLTQYGVVYGSTTTAMATTAAGTTTQVLHGNGAGAPTWGAVSLTADVSGTLPVANGGTGQTTYTDGQLLIGNSTGNTLTKSTLTAGTGISITNGSGAITIAATNNGTVTSVTASAPLASSGGATPNLSLTGTVDVANGGTGLSTATAYALLTGGTTSTGAFQQVSGTGTAGQILTSNGAGALPSWQAAPATGATRGFAVGMSLIFS